MAMSYDIISLDHLANHLIYLSASSSFWFSLKSSYDHELAANAASPIAVIVIVIIVAVIVSFRCHCRRHF